jgi:hypothetical protein
MAKLAHDDADRKNGAIPPHLRILLSEDDACRMFSISKPVFRSLVAAGHIGPVQLPGGVRRRLYLRATLERWAASLPAIGVAPASSQGCTGGAARESAEQYEGLQ